MTTHYRTPLRPTHFHPRTAPLCLQFRWGPWAGYAAPLCYGDSAMEYTALRNAAGVYDLCPMTKYRITGPDAQDYLNRLTLRDVGKLAPGGVHYTAWCDDAGKVVDDGTLFRLSPTDFRICCQERHLPWLLDSAFGYDVKVHEETDDIASLSLQGPCSASVLRAAGFDIDSLKSFRCQTFPFGRGLMISRTGFTGDLGYELWCDPADALALWDLLMEKGAPWGIRPIGSDALNIARLEAGFIVAGLDFTPVQHAVRANRARSPLELGLDWMIGWDKGPFTGRAALLREKEQGSEWALVGLDIPGNIPAEGAILYHKQKSEAGTITAAAWSPTLKANIAIAQVKARFVQGNDLWVEIYAMRELHYEKLMLKAAVVPRPFFLPDRRRATPPGVF